MTKILATLICLSSVLSMGHLVCSFADVIDPSRRMDWSGAGAGTIPNRTTVCATLNPGATAAQINSAIANCPAGQVVYLNAGTYNLSAGIIFNRKSNVTVRGAGPDKTFLVFSAGDSCGGLGGNTCMMSAGIVDLYSCTTANWTAGYARGATALTFSTTAGLSAGMYVLLDQANEDGADPFPEVWNCHKGPTACSVIADLGQREQMQLVTVTSVSGSTVNITPGLYMANWRSGQTPRARWTGGIPSVGDGIEDLSIDGSGSATASNVFMYGMTGSWVKNVRSVDPRHHHVTLMLAPNNTIRDSYFFDNQSPTSESYGVDIYFSGDDLVENNIFQKMSSPQVCEYGWGSIFAYNFGINNSFGGPGSTWAQLDGDTHRVGCYYLLWEGNDGMGVSGENYHGSSSLGTAFRNRYRGSQPGKDSMTVAINDGAYARFWNYVGNVLGDTAWATTYQMVAGVDQSDSSKCNKSIFAIGWGGNCDSGDGVTWPPDDIRTGTTALRWGNYDTVTGTIRFVASEVPSGLSKYANPVPSSQTLPVSLYLSTKPSWWGSLPWPAVGPDVSGGDIPNVGGHAYRIPARRCFEDVMGGTFGDTTARTFNANNCYQATVSILYGDVSENGTISSYDASLAAQYAVGSITLTSSQTTKADVSGNGSVTAYDASLIAQYAVGLITRFPVEG